MKGNWRIIVEILATKAPRKDMNFEPSSEKEESITEGIVAAAYRLCYKTAKPHELSLIFNKCLQIARR